MTDHRANLDAEFLFTMRLQLAQTLMMPNGPHGTRVFAPVLGGTVEGPRLNGVVNPGGHDWVTARANGTAQLDVRLTIITNDGALIFMEYRGILDSRPGGLLRTAPLFQAADDRYSWLNDVQAVGQGTPGVDQVEYAVYALV